MFVMYVIFYIMSIYFSWCLVFQIYNCVLQWCSIFLYLLFTDEENMFFETSLILYFTTTKINLNYTYVVSVCLGGSLSICNFKPFPEVRVKSRCTPRSNLYCLKNLYRNITVIIINHQYKIVVSCSPYETPWYKLCW